MADNKIIGMVEEAARIEVLYPALDKLETGVVVETGVFMCHNLIHMATHTQGKSILYYGVDNFSGYYNNEGDFGCGHTDFRTRIDTFEQCHQHIYNNGVCNNTRLVISNSVRASSFFDDESVDIIFFDTVHTYTYLHSEISIWYPKIKNGGLISGHDYLMMEVAKAVNAFFSNYIISTSSDNNTWYLIK